ncbi:MAG: SDR family oxidoreductase [Actinomycetota bacterium]
MSAFPFRSALVTGASAGIGAEMARQLGEAGVPTVLVARRRERLEEIASRHDDFDVLEADLTTADGLDAVSERLADTDAPIDLLVNNAGFGTGSPFHEIEADRLADEIGLNVTALTVLSNVALRSMVERGRGYLLNVASVVAFQASPGLATYAATKAYVQSLTEALHEEMRPFGVHVSSLCPGLTRTEFQEVSSTEGYIDRIPGLAWTEADDVARAGLVGVAKNRATIVPGALYKGAVAVGQVTPRAITRRIGGLVTRT